VGWVLVAVGVAGEGIAEGFVSNADGLVQTFNGILLADAQKETALALERAAQAEATARGFEAQIAESRKEAEAEHLARVKIEAGVAWRHLTDIQKKNIGSALVLGGFSKRIVNIVYDGGIESSMFASDIAEALRAGQVMVSNPGGMISMQAVGVFGQPITRESTGVFVRSTNDPESRSFADEIIRELTSRGFDAGPTNTPVGESPTPMVWVNVGPRPEGPQGEYKLEAGRPGKIKSNGKDSVK
jgi:hypothetical protein